MTSLEVEILQGRQLDREKLKVFGFVERGCDLVYTTDLLDGDFQVQLVVSEKGDLSGRVVDSESGEEYTVFRSAQGTGPFVGQVRQAYRAILEELVAVACQTSFITSRQGQRLQEYLVTQYGDFPSNPFIKNPSISAFRNPFNDKWYALVMTIERGKLDLGQETWSIEEKELPIEVVNLKIQPDRLSDLLETAGIYPSYHMNKKHWVTVVLDDQVSDALLFDLVATSRYLTLPKKEQKRQVKVKKLRR